MSSIMDAGEDPQLAKSNPRTQRKDGKRGAVMVFKFKSCLII